MKRFGTYLLPHKVLTAEERLSAIREAGFGAICLDWEDGYFEADGPREKQPELAAKHNFVIEHAHLSSDNANAMWTDDTGAANWFVNRAINELDLCKACGVPVGVLHVTYGLQSPPLGEIALPRFSKIAEHAEKIGVFVAIENSVSVVHLDYLLEHIDSDKMGFCFDSGHRNCFTPEADPLKKHRDRLMAMHLHDNDGKEDLHAIPFTGTVDWADVISTLNKTELGKQAITLESTPPNDCGYDAFLAHQREAFCAVQKIDRLSKEL